MYIGNPIFISIPSIEMNLNTNQVMTRRKFMQVFGLGMVCVATPTQGMQPEEDMRMSQVPNQKEQRSEYNLAFTYPYAIDGGFLIGLTCKEKPGNKRALWKYSMEDSSLEKIADLPEPYSTQSGTESEVSIPNFYGPSLRASDDGKCVVLRIIQSSGRGTIDFFHKENYLLLDVKKRRWHAPINSDNLLGSNGYFLPDTHLFLVAKNYFSSKDSSKKRVIFTEMDFDTETYIDYLNMPMESLLDTFITSSSRVYENDSIYQVYVINLLDITRMTYQDRTTPEKHIQLLGYCKIGGMTHFFREIFLTSDGRYLGTNEFLFELVGDDFKSRMNNLENAKIVLNFEGIRNCIGWNPTQELVAFKGEVPLVGRVGTRRIWYPQGYPVKRDRSSMDREELRELLEHGERLEKIPYLSVFDRNGKLIHEEYTPWGKVQYSQWYDQDNILIVGRQKPGNELRIKMINIKNGQKQSLLEQKEFPKADNTFY